MKDYLGKLAWYLIGFIIMLVAMGYFNGSYVGIKKTFSDPVYWIGLGVVVIVALIIRFRRGE